MRYHKVESMFSLQSGSIAPIVARSSKDRYETLWIRPRTKAVGRKRRAPKLREVYRPLNDLKKIQRDIGQVLSRLFKPHPIAHAYAEGRDIVTNARTHLDASVMLHIDLVDFFGSIEEQMVIDALNGVLPGVESEDIALIADLCCRDGRLPQGSPASPVLSNLVCIPLDLRLANAGLSAGCNMGRYSDDIDISTSEASFPSDLASERNGKVELGQPLLSIIEESGFRVNWAKVRFQTRRTGLSVTGLNVGDRVTTPRGYRDNIRAALDRWAKEGVEKAARRTTGARSAEHFVNAVSGSIGFVGYVHGTDCVSYRRLKDDFTTLSKRDLA